MIKSPQYTHLSKAGGGPTPESRQMRQQPGGDSLRSRSALTYLRFTVAVKYSNSRFVFRGVSPDTNSLHTWCKSVWIWTAFSRSISTSRNLTCRPFGKVYGVYGAWGRPSRLWLVLRCRRRYSCPGLAFRGSIRRE